MIQMFFQTHQLATLCHTGLNNWSDGDNLKSSIGEGFFCWVKMTQPTRLTIVCRPIVARRFCNLTQIYSFLVRLAAAMILVLISSIE